MTNNSGLIEEIFYRRIPQIIGMYVAAVWLFVEIADWMSDRFGISSQFSSYVFIGMLTFLPSVILLAWGHGRPGKDRWTITEAISIPVNVIIAFFAINVLIKPVIIPDSPDVPQVNALIPTSQVTKSVDRVEPIEVNNNIHNKVISFFWDNQTNDSNLDWLSYGATWLFSKDLQRTPNISVTTPYDSRNVLNELSDKGFNRSLNVPLSLALQVANNNAQKWLVLGSFINKNDALQFEAKLYNVETGIMEKVLNTINDNIFKALDQISNDISSYLLEKNDSSGNIIPDLAIADHTSNNLEAIKYVISAKNKVTFDNDYQGAIDDVLMALEMDESFAEANVLATNYYQAVGDFPNAIKQSKKALELDYKIYKESVFQLRANLFDMHGQQENALLVLETWTKVFPTSTIANAALARKYLFSDDQLDKAERQFEKLLSLDSNNDNTFVNLGRIYRVKGEKDKTLEVLEKYLAANPDKVDAYMELANAYRQFSMFDKAIAMYQQASILGSKDYEAEVAIASTIALTGDYRQALQKLDDLLVQSSSDLEKFNILNEKISIFTRTGQIRRALETLTIMQEPAKNILSPLQYLFTVDTSRVMLYMSQGDFDKALQYAQTLKENTKPPFTNLISVFYILIYMEMEDEEKFTQELAKFEVFLQTFPVSYYNQYIIAWNGRVSYWQGDLEKSIAQLDEAILASKQSIIGLETFDVVDLFIYGKANILFEMNKTDQALKELDFILYRNPLFIKSHLLKAKIYQQIGNDNQAQQSIAKGMEILKDADADFVDLVALKQLQS